MDAAPDRARRRAPDPWPLSKLCEKFPSAPLVAWRRMRIRQKYRMRTPSTGREVVIEAEPGALKMKKHAPKLGMVPAWALAAAPPIKPRRVIVSSVMAYSP